MGRRDILLVSNTYEVEAVTDEGNHIGAVIDRLWNCALLLVFLEIELGAWAADDVHLGIIRGGHAHDHVLVSMRVLGLLTVDHQQVAELIFILHSLYW